MTALENAEAALDEFKHWMAEGHPWVPGLTFINNPGLDEHIRVALEEFVRLRKVEELAKPARRVSLTDKD